MSRKLPTCRTQCNLPAKQAGAGLPIALFIVTVLSLIVLGMSQLQESSGNAISLQIQSQRAFFAAESGAQVVIADLLKAADGDPLSVTGSEEVVFSGVDGLSGCRAEVDYSTDSEVVSVKSYGVCGAETQGEARRMVEVMLRAD